MKIAKTPAPSEVWGFWRKAAIVTFVIAAFAGWYGDYAGYSLGFEAGSKDLNQTAQNNSFQKGFDAGKLQASRESQPQIQQEVETQVRERERDMETRFNQQMQAQTNQAFQAGAAAQAKAMMDHAIGFTVGAPKPKEPPKKPTE